MKNKAVLVVGAVVYVTLPLINSCNKIDYGCLAKAELGDLGGYTSVGTVSGYNLNITSINHLQAQEIQEMSYATAVIPVEKLS